MLHHRSQHVRDAGPVLGGDEHHFLWTEAKGVLQLLGYLLRLRHGQVDLVDDGDDGQVVLQGNVDVGQGLGLNALAGIHHQQHPLAGAQAPRDLVAEVHVAGSIDEVQLVLLAVGMVVLHPHRLGLDGDTSLPLQVHLVKVLLHHRPSGNCAGGLQKAVGQGGLAVVYVGDDAEVADKARVHGRIMLTWAW